jgi:hypothetical protein
MNMTSTYGCTRLQQVARLLPSLRNSEISAAEMDQVAVTQDVSATEASLLFHVLKVSNSPPFLINLVTSTPQPSLGEENSSASQLSPFLFRGLGNALSSTHPLLPSCQTVPGFVPDIPQPTCSTSLAIQGRPWSPLWLPPNWLDYKPVLLFAEAPLTALLFFATYTN